MSKDTYTLREAVFAGVELASVAGLVFGSTGGVWRGVGAALLVALFVALAYWIHSAPERPPDWSALLGAVLELPKRTKPTRCRIPQEIRQAVFDRDGGRCVECGATHSLEIDHIIPHSRGGSDTMQNLRVLCSPCNRRKGNRYVG